jgi:hypothetical protein
MAITKIDIIRGRRGSVEEEIIQTYQPNRDSFTTEKDINIPVESGWVRVEVTDGSGHFTYSMPIYLIYEPGSQPVVNILASKNVASEVGPQNGVFTISRTAATSDLVVYYTISGTATNGEDYETIADSITLPSGEDSATITITPRPDSIEEGDETVNITLLENSDYAIGTPNSATVTITEEDLSTTALLMKRGIDKVYPNPFNPECYIPVNVKCKEQNVKCKIYNILGQLVREVDSRLRGNDNIGNSIYWDGRDNTGCEVAGGVYFYEVAGQGVRKMVVLK